MTKYQHKGPFSLCVTTDHAITSPTVSPRLRYSIDWLYGEVLHSHDLARTVRTLLDAQVDAVCIHIWSLSERQFIGSIRGAGRCDYQTVTYANCASC